jgi:hypothetical protein
MKNKSELKELDFQILFGAIKHFGKNLYTTNPPAIAELVANAWDAYATECKIMFINDGLLIIDNGIGMTDEEFKERYAKSGYDKDYQIRIPSGYKERPYMGKKGIGKFSAFSLSDVYELYTKSEEDKTWKKIVLKNDELMTNCATVKVPIERIENINNLKLQFAFDFDYPTGTIIYLPNLKRKITDKTISSLTQLLPRRFSSNLLKFDEKFKLYINENPLDLEKHFFYNSIENIYVIGIEENEITKKFSKVKKENIKILKPLKEGMTGWLATVDTPAKLKAEDDTRLNGVSIYINGKIADDNILKNAQDARIANSYFIGEIDASYLQQPNIDPVLSSREGLNLELKEVKDLKDYLVNQRNTIIDEWDEMRAARDLQEQDYIQRAISKPEYKKYYDKLDAKAQCKLKKYTQKLFDKPSENEEKTNKLIDLMFTALLQIVNNETIDELINQIGSTEEEILEAFQKIFNITEINHAIRLREGVRSNLQIIKELENYIKSGEVEKVFEKHLQKNPWLIEPTWMTKVKSIHSQNYFKLLDINNSPEKLYTDLIVEVSDEDFPIIIEIKREKATDYSTPNVYEICTQINKYKTALSDVLTKEKGQMVYAKDIKSYFICGDVAFNKLDQNSRDILTTNNINIRSYDELIRTSKRIYEVNFNEDIENV